MPSSNSPRSTPRLAIFSVFAAPIAWIITYASGRVAGAAFSEGAANRMILLLLAGAAVTLAGLVLGILAVRMQGANRVLAILGLVLNSITAAFLLILGLIWLGMSL